MTKICNKCNTKKELKEFTIKKDTNDGYRGFCKDCQKNDAKVYYQKNKELMREKSKNNYRRRNPIKLKTCSKCKEVKGTKSFYKYEPSPDGLRHQCKACTSNYNKNFRKSETSYTLDRKKKIPNPNCSYTLKDRFISAMEMMCVTIDGEMIPLDVSALNNETCEFLIKNGHSYLFELSNSNERIIVTKPEKNGL